MFSDAAIRIIIIKKLCFPYSKNNKSSKYLDFHLDYTIHASPIVSVYFARAREEEIEYEGNENFFLLAHKVFCFSFFGTIF
jgi:hypothetical protein